jgi:folate-binding protein YgfZ
MLTSVRLRPLPHRARLILKGADRKRFLHGMLTNDINNLRPGQGCHAAMLTVKGKMLADLIVYDRGEEGLLLDLESVAVERVRADLDRHIIMDDAAVSEVPGWDALGVYGSADAAAAAALGGALGVAEGALRALPPYHHLPAGEMPESGLVAAAQDLGGEPERRGFHVIGPAGIVAELSARLQAAGAAVLSEDEAEVLRVEAGVPRYGLDMDEERLPLEARLDDAVSFQKGCYLGQEVIARVTARGHINRKLVGLRFSTEAPPPRGTQLSHPDRENAGTVMTGAVSPRHGAIALGYVHRTLWEPGTELQLPGGGVARVAALPFA